MPEPNFEPLMAPPLVPPPLDPGFRPGGLLRREWAKEAQRSKGPELALALERGGGSVSVFKARVLPDTHPMAGLNGPWAERMLKFLLWQRGAWRVTVLGPEKVFAHLAGAFAPGGARAFDAQFMAKVYGHAAFEVRRAAGPKEFPTAREAAAPLGGHLDGCRIGFDAGGSDRKVAALIDGKEVFSTETVWHPKQQADPQYHIDGIMDSMRQAAAHLPRVDAIGVSSAGIFVDRQTRVASLFRLVPEEAFEARIRDIYPEVALAMGNVPLEVANDGDVAALAGAMELKDHPVLGLAMGTSQAAGYVDSVGSITGWLNELAFAPVDESPEAPLDTEWSGDRGTGVHYFSQEAVVRLAPRAGISLDPGFSPASKLKAVQDLLAKGDQRPIPVFESIGAYLGYALMDYAGFYELKHVLLLGRVTSGRGGSIILEKALEVLSQEAPDLKKKLSLHLPDEASRRVGQAVAAASLPELGRKNG